MYLKEIRMENFKSFGQQRLSVPIKPGFTAITGPNGAGKSNIGDAILFVLGPRSARMIRAQKLTDLIFNGGKAGKAAKECEVSLVFDNSDRMMPMDEDEVVLMRRIRKAPKRGKPDNSYSYFYINGRAAALNQFVDLLQHARISAEGYNIVTQGAVTQLVEMTNVERRQVLDSIAGITEFDGDIEKAEKKRLQVEENLERVDIVLGEVRRNLEDLKKARDAAIQYKELKERRDVLRSVLVFRRKEEIELQIAAVEQEIQSREASKTELKVKLETVEQKLKEATRAKQDVEAKIADLGGPEGSAAREELKKLQAASGRLEERINYHRDEVKDYKADQKVNEEKVAKVRAEIEEILERRKETETGQHAAEARLKTARSDLKVLRERIAGSDPSNLRLNQELAKLRSDYETTTDQVHKRKLEQDRFAEKLEAIKQLVEELTDARDRNRFEIKDIDFQVDALDKKAKATGESTAAAEKELTQALGRRDELTKQLNELEPAIQTLQREYHSLRAKEAAEASVGKGLTRAVEAVLQAKRAGKLAGIHGTIAELGKAEPKFETALQTAAGHRMMSIVTDDDAAAAAAIEFLRHGKLGRATFLPLNKMVAAKPRAKALMVVNESAAVGFAADLVKFDPRYQRAFSYVLGDTIVIKGLDEARKLMGGVRLVTVDGDLIEASGAMVGGSAMKRSGIRFEGKDVARLNEVEAKLNKAVKHQETLTEQLVALRTTITDLEGKLSKTRSEQAPETDLQAQASRKAEFHAKLETIGKQLERKEQEVSGLEDSIAKNDERIQKLEAHLADLEQRRKDRTQAMAKGTKKEWAEKLTALEKDVEAYGQEAMESRSELATMENQQTLLTQRLEELEARTVKAKEAIENNGVQIEASKKTLAETEEKIAALTNAEAKMSSEADKLSKERDQLFETVQKLTAQADNWLNKIDTVDTLITGARNRLPTIEEALGEVLVELRDLGTKEPPDDAPSLAECKQEIQTIDRQVNALGPVNMLALEEYDKQAEREGEFIDEIERLNVQRDDLIKVVDELVARKKEGLLRVMKGVNDNLGTVYEQLTGGEALIELENPEAPFEAGLLLKARPVGKRIQRLQALSGGEKSMAALAFVFAIQEYEPSPFYVLDEIDMFLDAVNSERVAEMVKANSKAAQFLIVSLRKVTLKEADHIYGVTMANDGISQMIANFDLARLKEADETLHDDGTGTADPKDQGKSLETIAQTVQGIVKVEAKK